ncbi:MAG TPA: PspC domain-containing protein [Pseudonocardiaceae bacterium]|nr:PspC domain-containing protein [Pseudonocardiaceae bacterium]
MTEGRKRAAWLSARPDGTPQVLRRRTGRVVGGVAGGLADHLQVNVLWVRLGFVALAALDGAGLVAYALMWMFIAQEPVGTQRENQAKEKQQGVALIALGISLAIATGALSGAVASWITIPVGVAVIGAAVVWREADAARRRRWVDGARTGVNGVLFGGGGWTALLRVLTGAVLVVAGIAVVVLRSETLNQLEFALVAAVATLVGVAVLTVPWWLRLVRDLGEERKARIRTDERAEIAAHLHDSVLQTLALIQKQPDVPREVLRLARGQERQLRTWLYSPDGYGRVRAEAAEDGSGLPTPPTLSAAIAAASGEVEDTFAIVVAPVFVGDCPMDEKLAALAQAAREAMVNAAKHSGQAEVSVYVEVEPTEVTVFVRDRGVGFDPAAVSPDRHGVADSIHGRMGRYGGTVKLRTAPGEGTEVQLTMPRTTTPAGTGPAAKPRAGTKPGKPDRDAEPTPRPGGRLRGRLGRRSGKTTAKVGKGATAISDTSTDSDRTGDTGATTIAKESR